MIKAALYARVSTEEQTKNYSIENQIENLRKYCQEHNYEIFKEYIDPGYSGTALDRPGLIELLQDARQGLFDVLLVYKLDRLFRNNRHMYNVLFELEELKIRFVSITEAFDTSTAIGKAYLGLAGTFAEWERNTFAERSALGIEKAVRKGKWSGGIVPYGYRHNLETGELEIDKEEAEVVRMIFSLFVTEKLSTLKIADRLSALGTPTKYVNENRQILRGKRKVNTSGRWYPGRVMAIIRSPVYYGVWHYGKRSKKRPPGDLIEGKAPAIISQELFDRAQEQKKINAKFSLRRCRQPYLLRGLIKCGVCGRTFIGMHFHKGGGYYRCNGKNARYKPSCPSRPIKAAKISAIVWDDVVNLLRNRRVLVDYAYKQIYQTYMSNGKEGPLVQEIERIKGIINERTNEIERLLELYAGGTIHVPELSNKIETKKRERDELLDHLSWLLKQQNGYEYWMKGIKAAMEFLEHFSEKLNQLNFEKKREIILNLVREITVTQDGMVDITYQVRPPKEIFETHTNAPVVI